MYITELFEAQEPSSILVVYPGRFQPWHKGHKMVYDYLTKIYGRDHVFVATSNKVDPPRSPFTFNEKQQFMHLTGISADRIVETRDPYRALELVQKYNPATTRLVLAVSEKDMDEDPRFKFGTKRDGGPTYLQPIPKNVNEMQPFETHGYIMTVPTFNFTVLGKPMRSATEVRAQFAQADEGTQQSIVKDLFGTYDRHVHDIMKQKLLPTVTESIEIGTKLNLTKNYGNFETLTGVVKDITPSGKLKIQITQAQLVPGKKGAVRTGDVVTMASNYVKNTIAENFADGKNPEDKGDAKRHGINTKASVSSLRKTAKQGGRKGQLAHWLANMKSGRARAKNEGVAEGNDNSYRRPTARETNRIAQQTQTKLNPTASKFVWKKPNQIGGSYSEQDLMARGFKKSQYNSWGGTPAMWERLTRVSEQLNQPRPTAQQILDKHNLTVEEFVAQLKLGVKVEFEHTKDAKTAYEIALDHLNERPDYYTVLAKTGLEEDSANPRVDLTPNYPNYSKLIGEFMGVNRNQKAVFKILAAELKPGQGSTDKIARSVSTGKLVAIDIARVKNRLTVAEAASGYIPTQAEKDDPRYKTALTVDVRPGTDKKNMRALRLIK